MGADKVHPEPGAEEGHEPSSVSSSPSKSRWAAVRGHVRRVHMAEGEGDADGKGGSTRMRRRQLASQLSSRFKAPSQLASESSESGESSFSAVRFQRISAADPAAQQPRTYVEFYKVLTRGHREAHAFINSGVDPLGFSETVNSLRKRLRKSNFMLLNPMSRKMQYWDCYMLSLLLYTATVAPYEICMVWEDISHDLIANPLYWLNWIVNISFIIDIAINFVLPYRTRPAGAQHPHTCTRPAPS